jgi:hypothetical protein
MFVYSLRKKYRFASKLACLVLETRKKFHKRLKFQKRILCLSIGEKIYAPWKLSITDYHMKFLINITVKVVLISEATAQIFKIGCGHESLSLNHTVITKIYKFS